MSISGHVATSALQWKSPLTIFTARLLGGTSKAGGLDSTEKSSALSYLQASYIFLPKDTAVSAETILHCIFTSL